MEEIFQKDLIKITEQSLLGKGDSDQHLLALYGITVSSRAKNIIELGTREGITALPMIMAAVKTGGHVYNVDIDDCELLMKENIHEAYDSYYTFVKQDALEFLKEWDPNKHIDVILIDDYHSYEHVKAELEILYEKSSYKTVILLHDLMYNWKDPFYHVSTESAGEWANGGPYKAVSELNSLVWEFSTLPWCNGLTILRKKPSTIVKTHYNILQ